jgi:hypothetical protein
MFGAEDAGSAASESASFVCDAPVPLLATERTGRSVGWSVVGVLLDV